MILNKTPLTLAQVKAYASDLEENKVLADYLKAFTNLTKEKAESLASEIQALNNPKIKEDLVIKVVDFLPQDAEDANKIFLENSLSEEETQALLAVVKKY
jgi:DNA-directed RNA polymerase subunit F